jgi:FKBP-type peptidyl-prolyl cis-trans isomerase
MTTMSTTRRTVYDIALAAAVSFSLIFAISARGANGVQEDQGKSKTMKKTASGLQYLDEKVGIGETPKTGQTCIMHYTGWLWEKNAKGKKFDSSKDRNEPFSFDIGKGEVIKGWDEGVATMKVGGKRHLLIPADLGYGARGAGSDIPPNATLLFEVELLGISTMKKTDSGLEYRDIKEGTGPSPKTGQICVMHYTGWLWEGGAKGRKFDSSVDRGKPLPFPLGERKVIAGWDEGVATMKVGGKRELLIPPALGYGARGAGGGVIPPNATLLFEVELLDVK